MNAFPDLLEYILTFSIAECPSAEILKDMLVPSSDLKFLLLVSTCTCPVDCVCAHVRVTVTMCACVLCVHASSKPSC